MMLNSGDMLIPLTDDLLPVLRQCIRSGIPIEGNIPLYQSSFSITNIPLSSGKIERLDVCFYSGINKKLPVIYKYLYMYVKNVKDDKIVYKDSYLSKLFQYLCFQEESVPSGYSGIVITSPSSDSISAIKSLLPLYNKNIMPQLSENAVISTAGDVKIDKKALYRKMYYDELAKKQAAKLAAKAPFKTVKPKREIQIGFVCLKDNKDGIIKRIQKDTAKKMVESLPEQYTYTTKLEWRIQRDGNRQKIVPGSLRRASRQGLLLNDPFKKKDGLRPRDKQRVEVIQQIPVKHVIEARIKEIMNPEWYTDKTQPRTLLTQAPAITIIKYKSIRKELPNTVINKQTKKINIDSRLSDLYAFKFYLNAQDDTVHHTLYKRCENGHPKQSAGKFITTLENRWIKKYPAGKIMFSIVPNTHKILPKHLEQKK